MTGRRDDVRRSGRVQGKGRVPGGGATSRRIADAQAGRSAELTSVRLALFSAAARAGTAGRAGAADAERRHAVAATVARNVLRVVVFGGYAGVAAERRSGR